MTISSQTNRVSYDGNGATLGFAVPFKFSANTAIKARLLADSGTDTSPVFGTDYTVTGAGGESGGTATFVVAPDSSQTVILYRDESLSQTLDLADLGNFPAENVEAAFDKVVMLCQRLSERMDRAVRLIDSDTSGVTITLPTAAARASKFLAFDASGNTIPSSGSGGYSGPVSSFMDTVLDDTNGSTALVTLGVSPFMATVLDETDASHALAAMGFSTKMQGLRDDTDASQAFATLGVIASVRAATCATDATLARAGFTAIDQTHSVIATGTSGHGSASNKIRRFTTVTTLGTALTAASDSTLGTVITVIEAGLYSVYYEDTASGGNENVGVSLDATSGDLTTAVSLLAIGKRIAYANSGTGLVVNVGGVARLAAGQIIRAHDGGACDSTFATLKVHRIGN